jgi:hypothetical protein
LKVLLNSEGSSTHECLEAFIIHTITLNPWPQRSGPSHNGKGKTSHSLTSSRVAQKFRVSFETKGKLLAVNPQKIKKKVTYFEA